MKARTLGWFAGGLASAAMLAIAVKIVWFPDAWEMRSTVTGGPCTVRRDWTQAEVAFACGPPDAVGMRPKVLSDRPVPHEWISFCSPPCEDRRGRVVFYDCAGRVAFVEPAGSAYCAGASPRTIRRQSS